MIKAWRSPLGVIAMAAIAAMAAGCSSTTAAHDASGAPATSTAATPAAFGVEAAIGDVPWAQVGAGWMLAQWSPAVSTALGVQPPPGTPTSGTATTSVYLVNPAGGRYKITTFPPAGDGPSPKLVDWSGDGSHALLSADGAGPTTVIELDLHTGTQSTFAVNGVDQVRYARPDGKSVLLTMGGPSGPSSLERVDLAGNHQLTYPVIADFGGTYLSTPDGTQLVLGTTSGLVLMGGDGTAGKTLPVAGQTHCTPVRWWDGKLASTVLTACDVADASNSRRLWLVPIDGGAPSALTAPNNGQNGPDLGDVNAWHLPSGTFVQALGACGSINLAKLNADGTTAQVAVPDTDPHHSIVVVGVNGGDLDLQAMVAGCGPAQSLIDYNPAAGTSTVVLGPPVNGGSAIDALPYPGQE